MVEFPIPRPLPEWRGSGLTAIVSALRGGADALVAAIADAMRQRRMFVVWPVAMILGLIAYRVMPFEPGPSVWLTLGTGGVLTLALCWRAARFRPLAQLGVAALCGFILLPVHGQFFGTQMIASPLYGTYSATIDDVIFNDGERQTWIISGISGEPDWAVPEIRTARVAVSGNWPVGPGDRIDTRIRFYPVPPPVVPGGYDSQFVSYFASIGAYGSVLGEPVVTASADGGLSRWVSQIRSAIGARIVGHLGDRIGGIAAALIVGDQSRITEADRELMASVGLAHILAISGLHLTLVAGTMFAAIRLLLALNHRLAQHWPIKKIAAVAGLLTAVCYLVISGMGVSAIRSTIMLALVFAAIIAGRQALTMRNVAIAALIIIAVDPASVFRASFQLSFAAVVALIAAYEMARQRRETRDGERAPRIARLAIDISVTSVIAGLATLIFTAYHFQQTAPFGVLGNLLAMPLVTFVIMPAALVGTLLIPFGLDGLAYAVMGKGIEIVLAAAQFVRSISGGFDPSPILAPSALVICLVALGWLAFLQTRARLIGPLLAIPLIVLFCQESVPDILIADGSQALAVRHEEDLTLIAGRNNTFATNVWSERYISPIVDDEGITLCDSIGCITETSEGMTLALVKDRSAFEEDCAMADVVVTRIWAPWTCAQTAPLVIDQYDLTRYGAHMVAWHGPDTPPEVRTSIDAPDRPWRPMARQD